MEEAETLRSSCYYLSVLSGADKVTGCNDSIEGTAARCGDSAGHGKSADLTGYLLRGRTGGVALDNGSLTIDIGSLSPIPLRMIHTADGSTTDERRFTEFADIGLRERFAYGCYTQESRTGERLGDPQTYRQGLIRGLHFSHRMFPMRSRQIYRRSYTALLMKQSVKRRLLAKAQRRHNARTGNNDLHRLTWYDALRYRQPWNSPNGTPVCLPLCPLT